MLRTLFRICRAMVRHVSQTLDEADRLYAIKAQTCSHRQEGPMKQDGGMEMLQYLSSAMIHLLDKHCLASAAFPVKDLREGVENRSLLVAMDKRRGMVYFWVCDSMDAVEQMHRLRQFTEGANT